MEPFDRSSTQRTRLWLAITLLLTLSPYAVAVESDTHLAAIFRGAAPQSVADLRAMEDHVRTLTERVSKATVAIQVGAAQGSGVIISPEGYVLTAAHVIGSSGRHANVFLHDGQRVSGTTLGSFRTMDAGLVKLTKPGNSTEPWPHISVGDSSQITPGQWCLAMGHPGGLQATPHSVVRLGRILTVNAPSSFTTDCTLIGGDSGGPLFDMEGRVIAIHSRIGGPLTANLHVPVNTFRESWKRLARGDNWGHTPGSQPYIGVQGDAESTGAKIVKVYPESPAAKAGIREGDVIVRFGSNDVGDFANLRSVIEDHEPGSKVKVELLRNQKRLQVELTVGRIRD